MINTTMTVAVMSWILCYFALLYGFANSDKGWFTNPWFRQAYVYLVAIVFFGIQIWAGLL